jgi:multidrug efflux pump
MNSTVPAIQGLGNSAGFSMYLIDQAGAGNPALFAAAADLIKRATADGRVTGLRSGASEDQAALNLVIDQEKAAALGVSLNDVNAMLSTVFAGNEVNDFQLGTALRPVIVQGVASSRMQPEDILNWYARNTTGEMVPFSAFSHTEWGPVAPTLARIDALPAVSITGTPAAGVSSGQAMDAMEELVAGMDGGWGHAWTDLSFQERQSGNQAPYLYALSVLVVFLCLAALYESWAIPLSVMLAVPVGVLGALVAAWLFGQSNDVYFKVGLLTTIGLAAKNAILIVEFARELESEGGAGRAGGRAHPPAPDPDDLAGIHLGRLAPRHRQRGRGRGAELYRHRRAGRDAVGNCPGDFHGAVVLRHRADTGSRKIAGQGSDAA